MIRPTRQTSIPRYSLEESIRRHGIQFRAPPYQHIVGRVSAHALSLLQSEVTRALDLGDRVDELCGCVMRHKCGLPCACELHRALNECGAIYLDKIHVFWKTLQIGDGVDNPDFVEEVAQDTEHFDSLVDEVRSRDPAQIRYVSRLIHHALYPESLEPGDPDVNLAVRGRPSQKGSSTRRKPSAFEYVGKSRSRSRCRSKSSGSKSVTDGSGNYF